MEPIDDVDLPKAAIKAVLLEVRNINLHETLSTREAVILFGCSQKTLSGRRAGKNELNGVHIR